MPDRSPVKRRRILTKDKGDSAGLPWAKRHHRPMDTLEESLDTLPAFLVELFMLAMVLFVVGTIGNLLWLGRAKELLGLSSMMAIGKFGNCA